MAEIIIRGISSIKLGAILGDGDMGTTLTALGNTVLGTARLETEDPTVTDFFSEENDNPIETVSTPGKTTLTWAINDFTAATLARVLGGTAGTKTWEMPASLPSLELSCEIAMKSPSGFKINIPRLKIAGKILTDLGKNALGQVSITGTVLTPTKALLAALYTTEP